jgi:hypothetical protein
MSAEAVANAFVAHYYQTADSNMAALSPLFVSLFCFVLFDL